LEEGWNADHIVAYAVGGETDVINGQALCPKCNQRKGTSEMSIPKHNPYQWQEEFIEKCRTHFYTKSHDYLLVVTPGGGKTVGALKQARVLFNLGLVQHIVVVAPTRTVVKQWVEKAHEMGFDLEANGGPERKRRYHGIVITYSAVANNAISYRAYCNVSTLLILDEVHHADEEESWGEALRQAFELPHTYRLMLSGTPFRTQGKIPFIKYDPLDPKSYKALADMQFGHGDAVNAGCCRPVYFPSIDVPNIEWKKGDRHFAASLSDTSLKDEQMRDRNSVVIDPSSEAVRLLLSQAHAKLIEVRKTHHNAGGLVLAKNQWHAGQLAKIVGEIAGTMPICVISDDPEALDNIERFKKSNDQWIVAVRMISEGADIPRLRIEAYLTSTDTPLFFRQAVGRITRQTKDRPTEYAYMFILNREPLITYAAELEEEQNTHKPEERKPHSDPGRTSSDDPDMDHPVLVNCEAEAGGTIVSGGAASYTPEEMRFAMAVGGQLPVDWPPERIAQILRDANHVDGEPELKRPREPKTDRMERKCSEANKLAFALGKRRGYEDREAGQRIHTEWKMLSPSNHWQDDMDEDELDRKIVWLKQNLARTSVA
jgi:superfamily II DNA or RNA helicase